MEKLSEYRDHAAECRHLARKMRREDGRQQLLRMAESWEALAKDRAAVIGRRREMGVDGE